jgi:hypothetical protein
MCSCSSGYYSPAGSTVCTECASGLADTDSSPSTPCVVCGDGTYTTSGQVSCHPCAAGTADTDTTPSTPCAACLSGYYAATEAVTCTQCPAGYHDVDSDPATPCDSDAESCVATDLSDSTAVATCAAVAIGGDTATNQAACAGALVCTFHASPLCPPGTHAEVGSTSCPDCVAGFADLDGDPATACDQCTVGHVSGAADTSCTICASGTADLDSDPSTACTQCAAGVYTGEGSTAGTGRADYR